MDPCAVAQLQYTPFTTAGGAAEDEEDLYDMYGPLHLDRAELILMPVNDNTDPFKISKKLIYNNVGY